MAEEEDGEKRRQPMAWPETFHELHSLEFSQRLTAPTEACSALSSASASSRRCASRSRAPSSGLLLVQEQVSREIAELVLLLLTGHCIRRSCWCADACICFSSS
jgi:hypothetical protein